MVSRAVAWGGDWVIGSNILGPPSWKPELQGKTPRCLAAEVSETGDLGERLASRRRGAPGLAALGSPGNRAAAEGAGFGRAGRLAGFGRRLGGCAAAEEGKRRGCRQSAQLQVWQSGGRQHNCPGGWDSPVFLPPPPSSEPVVRSLTARRRSPRVSRPVPGRGGRRRRPQRRSGLGVPGGGAVAPLAPGRLPRPHLTGWWLDLSPRRSSL